VTLDPALTLATLQCPHCAETVPVGVFCGACGAHLTGPNTHHSARRSRTHAYAACANEPVLHLTIVSSLFPHLPHRSRTPFRTALVLLAALLITCALLRLQAPLIAISALGFPALFQLYLQESDVYDVLPVPRLIAGAVLGALLGWGWAQLTAAHVATTLRTAMISGLTASQTITTGVLIPLGGLVLMLAPAVALRLTQQRSDTESLDGFLFGAIGALGFTIAATLTRLEPQLRTGLIAHGRPRSSLVIEAFLQGAAVPLTAAGVGGLVGATLWIKHRPHRQPRHLLTSPVVAVLAAALLYAALGLLDLWQPSDIVLLALHGLGAALALLVLRIGLHAVLLGETHEVTVGAPHRCSHCEQIVPRMPFCPHCGTASRASARSQRTVTGNPRRLSTADEGSTP
jgi:hypothetical protein